MIALTGLDKKLYSFIEEYILEHGYAPSYREMAKYLNVSTSTINYHIRNLQIMGYVQTDCVSNSPRALRLTSLKIERREDMFEPA